MVGLFVFAQWWAGNLSRVHSSPRTVLAGWGSEVELIKLSRGLIGGLIWTNFLSPTWIHLYKLITTDKNSCFSRSLINNLVILRLQNRKCGISALEFYVFEEALWLKRSVRSRSLVSSDSCSGFPSVSWTLKSDATESLWSSSKDLKSQSHKSLQLYEITR